MVGVGVGVGVEREGRGECVAKVDVGGVKQVRKGLRWASRGQAVKQVVYGQVDGSVGEVCRLI